jgi:hypothetical protein
MRCAVKRFQLGLPALDAFPRKLWSHLAARQARAPSATDMACREAIAAYLAVARHHVQRATGRDHSWIRGRLDPVIRTLRRGAGNG